MRSLLWAERQKLRRSKIVWIAVFAVIMIVVIVFIQGQYSYDGVRFINRAGWLMTATQSLGTFFVIPAVIALLGGYIICREEHEDILKSLLIIPISETRLTFAKMIMSLILSIIIYFSLFVITLTAEIILNYEDLTFGMINNFLRMYLLNGFGVFLAISPIIAIIARLKKSYWLALIFAQIFSFAGLFAGMLGDLMAVYPLVAVFIISGYYYDATSTEVIISIISLLTCVAIAFFILFSGVAKQK